MKDAQKSCSLYNYRKYLSSSNFIKSSSKIEDVMQSIGKCDMFPGLSSREMEREFLKFIVLLSSSLPEDRVVEYREKNEMEFTREQEKREYSFSDWIYDLVFQSRYTQYVMDQDPEKELEKLAELCPRIYCVLYPVLRRMMNPDDATTLMVYGVPLHACEDDVRESFSSFGEIEYVEMEREKISQTAYVTYKDPEAAKFAIDLANPRVCNLKNYLSACVRKHLRSTVRLLLATLNYKQKRSKLNYKQMMPNLF